MASDTLAAAIKRKWATSGELKALVPKVYLEEVPERDEDDKPLDIPYAWCDIGKSKFDWTFEADYFEFNAVDFHVLAAGAEKAEQISQVVFDLFAWKDLTFLEATNKSVSFMPTDGDIRSEMLRYRDGSVLFRVVLSFESNVARQLKP